MARIRTIKPEFFTDEALGALAPLDRLLFAGLWCHADKAGRLFVKPLELKVKILPYDDYDVASGLMRLAEKQLVILYEHDGLSVLQITNWEKHQRPHHTERDSVIPPHNGYLTVKEPLENGGKGKERNGREGKEEIAQPPKGGIPREELLDRLVECWNTLPPEVAPRVAKPRASAILRGWASVQRDPEARDYFADAEALVAHVRQSPFLHGQGWFRFTWLFARGKDREWNIVKIFEGRYKAGANQQRQPSRSPDDPYGNKAALTAFLERIDDDPN